EAEDGILDRTVTGVQTCALPISNGSPIGQGWVYLLDRQSGAPLIGIDERLVPQFGDQKTAPTQPWPIGDPFVPQACTETIGSYRSEERRVGKERRERGRLHQQTI